MSATEDRDEALIARIETLAHGMFTGQDAADVARLIELARRGVTMKRWLVMHLGCKQCGDDPVVVGAYEGKDHADNLAAVLRVKMSLPNSCRQEFDVFDLAADMPAEYRKALEGKQT